MSGVISEELAGTIAQSAQAGFTGVQAAQSLQQGKALNQISKQRAAVDIANAKAAERRAGIAAKIKLEQGKRAIATNIARTAASGITVGMGSDVVVAAETKANVLRDVGFILEGGEVERQGFLASAGLERARGRLLRSQSRWQALTQGLSGGSEILTDAIDAGLFKPEEKGNG